MNRSDFLQRPFRSWYFLHAWYPRRIMIRIARSIDDRGHKIDHLSSVMRFKRRVYNAFYRTRFSRATVALQLLIRSVALHRLLHGVRHPFQKSILSFDCFNPRWILRSDINWKIAEFSGLLKLNLSGPCFDRQEVVVAPSNAGLEFIRNSSSLHTEDIA